LVYRQAPAIFYLLFNIFNLKFYVASCRANHKWKMENKKAPQQIRSPQGIKTFYFNLFYLG